MVKVDSTNTLLKPDQLNSKYLKSALAGHLYFNLQFSIIADEFKFMDIFGVRQTGYTVEYEIKVSKSDLDRELKLIKTGEGVVQKHGKDWEKWHKHYIYLNNRYYDKEPTALESILQREGIKPPPPFMPNEFYFYVPDFLADYAAYHTASLPYGVVKIGKYITPSGNPRYYGYTIVKRAKKLHTDKVAPNIIHDLAHALTIRSRLFKESFVLS